MESIPLFLYPTQTGDDCWRLVSGKYFYTKDEAAKFIDDLISSVPKVTTNDKEQLNA